MDELIDELLETPEMSVTGSGLPASTVGVSEKDAQKHRERLAALAAGGQAKQYGLVVKGAALTADQVDLLAEYEVEKLSARYEARLGEAMTKRWGRQPYSSMPGQQASFYRFRQRTNLR